MNCFLLLKANTNATVSFKKNNYPEFLILILKRQTVRMCEMRGCGEKGTILHCWWECKLVQPVWKMVSRVLKN